MNKIEQEMSTPILENNPSDETMGKTLEQQAQQLDSVNLLLMPEPKFKHPNADLMVDQMDFMAG